MTARSRRCVFLLGLAAVVLPVALLACSIDGLFYYPNDTLYSTPAQHGLTVEEVAFRAWDGTKLHGWWAPAVATAKAKGTVVFCHGNYGNVSHHVGSVAWLPRRGFNLLLFDYRGYGQSEGELSREGTVADAIAAIDFALARDAEHTVVFGHSLGGAVAIPAVAARPQVKAVAVESTFPSYREAAGAAAPPLFWLTSWLVSKGFDPEDALANLPPRPLLIIHGTDDHIVPFRLGKHLYDLALEPKTLYSVEGGRHITPWAQQGERFEAMLCEFFESAL
jgi:fermentation-respiration switch protein FrsA (DUF1100 family)